jgi:hypothetical protein
VEAQAFPSGEVTVTPSFESSTIGQVFPIDELRLGVPVEGLAKGKVLDDDRADWREAWALFPSDVIYIWHTALQSAAFVASLEAEGF